ncbi:hypothetical protein HNP92_001041 [Methanococcus maripaludis]|uniref:Dolichyl-phosphate-mannose-protein mannosyltransferase n=1 Tax=Methanococcus maripaludis TaxID=39152 RepID=A0A7J9S6S6_METMI|nr:hypothetical protein [Methanococcus maripaludis]MBB6401736.1 hypothetical protein [Methanococcus maripaludis]
MLDNAKFKNCIKKTGNYLLILLIILSISIPNITYKNTMDDFAPKHIAMCSKIANEGVMEKSFLTSQIPGFYVLGSLIMTITGIPSEKLLYLPIQLLPYLAVFFVLAYRFSKNVYFAGILSIIEITTGLTGSSRVFFWPHGIGYIIFFSALLLVITSFSKNTWTKSHSLSILLLGTSLAFISYNLNAILLILIFISIFVLYILKKPFKKILLILITLVVINVGISEFIYSTFIPLMNTISGTLEISALEKFMIQYFSSKYEKSPLESFFISSSRLNTLVSLIKYMLIYSLLGVFFIMIIKRLKDLIKIRSYIWAVPIIYTLTMAVFTLPRIYIGNITVTFFYYPSIFALCYLFSLNSKKIKCLCFLTIMALISSNYIIYSENEDMINKVNLDIFKTNYGWMYLHKKDNLNVLSDELSKNLILLQFYSKGGKNPDEKINEDIFKTEDILKINNMDLNSNSEKYYLMNYDLNQISIHNWIVLKSPKIFKKNINMNYNISKVYDNSHNSIYLTNN